MTVETVDTVLPVPGPSPTNDGQSYIARKPVTSGDTPVAEIGSPVTGKEMNKLLFASINRSSYPFETLPDIIIS